MSVDIACGKCGERIASMKTLKSIREMMSPHKGKCPSCGHALSVADFALDVEEM